MKVLEKNNVCKVYFDFSDCDYWPLENVNEFINESQTKEGVFITLFVYNYYCGCTEPFNGYSIKEKGVISKLKKEYEDYCRNN